MSKLVVVNTTPDSMRWMVMIWITFALPLNKSFSQDAVYPFIDQGKIGFKDERDSILIQPVYDYYDPFQPGHDWAVIGTGDYDRLSNSSSERQVAFSGKFGFISSSGTELFSPRFDMVLEVFTDYAIVGTGEGRLEYLNWPEGKNIHFSGNIGVVSRDGYFSVPIGYQDIQRIHAEDDVYWFALDDQGDSFLYRDSIQLDFPENVVSMGDYSAGRARIRLDEKWGFVDQSGLVVIPPLFDQAKDFSADKAFVKSGEKYIWIDTLGRELPEEKSIFFEEVGSFSEGYAKVKVFDDFGYIYPDSSFFIFPRFKEARPFFNGIAAVETEDAFGYVYTDGRKDIVRKYADRGLSGEPDERAESKLPDYEPPLIQWTDSTYFFSDIDTLTIGQLVDFQAEAMRWAPFLYYEYPQMLAKVSAGEGTLAGRFLFHVSFLAPGNVVWETFKREVLFSWLSDERTRRILWKLASPVYKSAYRSMPELHQQVYRDILDYLEAYYANYDIEATRKFLEESESFFAHEHPDGSRSPYRKLSAQIDRLILIYGVISVEDVQEWIRKVKREVAKW